jgi:hypothetical protein
MLCIKEMYADRSVSLFALGALFCIDLLDREKLASKVSNTVTPGDSREASYPISSACILIDYL